VRHKANTPSGLFTSVGEIILYALGAPSFLGL